MNRGAHGPAGHPRLDAAAAVAGVPPTTTLAVLRGCLEGLGVDPEVVANTVAVRFTPREVELDVVLLAVERGPYLTVRVPIVG